MAVKLGRVGKQRNHRSTKKTFKKKKLRIFMEKSCRRHLLLQKSDGQKKLGAGSKKLEVSRGDAKNVRALAPSL